jgi:hypothetical protein
MNSQLPLLFDHSKYRDDFAHWLTQNWHVWEAFARKADQVWNCGRRHYSARTIVEVLRFESSIAEVGGEFKVNNNYAPDLARLYMETYPERADLFDTRLPANARRAA